MSSVHLDLWRDFKSWIKELPDNALLSPEQIAQHIKDMEEEYI